MKVSAYFHGAQRNGYIVLKPAAAGDAELVNRLFAKKAERENRRGEESLLECTMDLPYRSKSYRQLAAVFALVTAIFESMENRKPTEAEKYDLYDDLLNEYGDRRVSRINRNRTRAVRLSESNTVEAAHFTEALMVHLATQCDLSVDVQADVRQVLWSFETWCGSLALDPNDYYDSECTLPLSETDWRLRHKFSAASGLSGNLHLHHIVSRGANHAAAGFSWNWIMLTEAEHAEMHRCGEKAFLVRYPHIAGRVKRAERLAAKVVSGT